MSDDKIVTKIKFKVAVDTSIIPPVFTFYNEENQATNGSVTAYSGEETQIIYSLPAADFFFVTPFITNNFNEDFYHRISAERQTLIIIDKGEYEDNIGLQLIIEQQSTGQRFASPDPRIKNVGR
jgi:hypothetical protein